MPYFQPAAAIEHHYDIKRSQFIVRVDKAETRDAAMALLAKAKNDYPDARHHCWAYLLGSPAQPISMASNDDGEPSGTAGKPMLNVLQHKDIGNIAVVVIRYFGGIKLGAGGLVRAYSASVQEAIEKLSLEEIVHMQRVEIEANFAEESQLRWALEKHQGSVLDAQYSSSLLLTVEVPESAVDEFKALVSQRVLQFSCDD